MVDVVLRLSSLGDLVLCSAFARRLAELEPRNRRIFWVEASLAPVVTGFGAGFEILPFVKGPWSLLRAFAAGWRLRRKLTAEGARIGTVYDLHGVGKTWAFRAGLRLAFPTQGFRSLVTPKRGFLRGLSVLFRRDLLGARHVYREHLELLERDSKMVPQLELVGASRRPRSILIAPDASKWKKKWPAESWAELLRRILSDPRKFEVTLVGGARTLPIDILDELETLGGDRFRNLLGKTAIEELPRIAAEHRLAICGNSAWLHLAEAAGTPVIALAGPIVPGFGFSPWRSESRELAVPLGCRPCTRHGGGACINPEYHACMKRITPALLWESFSGWWQRYGSAT